MATTEEGLNIRLGGTLDALISALRQARAELASFANNAQQSGNAAAAAINSLSPASSAAAAGITNLSQAVNSGQASIVTLGNSTTQTAQSLNSLSPASSAAAAGITNLSNAINAGNVALNGVTINGQRVGSTLNFTRASTDALNVSIRNFNRNLLSTSPIMRGFANDARNGQLSLVGLNGQLTNLGRGVTRASGPLNQLGGTTNRTGQIATNFGRVISDLPYGFTAIQNNIDPLIASLGGPAGLALAITIVGSALAQLSLKYGGLGNAFNVLNPLVSNQEKGLNALNAAMLTNANSAAQETSSLDLLYKATKDLNIPLEERKKITDELIKQYPKTFDGFTAETLAVGAADEAYKKLTKTLLAKAAIDAGTEAISKQGKSMLELRLEADKLNKELIDLQQNGTKPSISNPFGRDAVSVANEISRVQNKINSNTRQQNDLSQQTEAIQKASLGLVEQFGAAVLGIKGDAVKSTSEIFKTLNEQLSIADAKLGLAGATAATVAKEKVAALTTAFDELIKAGLKPTSPEVKKVVDQINALGGINQHIRSVKSVSNIMKDLQAALSAVDYQASLTAASFDSISKDKIAALQKAFDDLVKSGLKPTSPELQKISSQITILGAAIIGTVPIQTKNILALGKAFQTIKAPNLSVQQLQDLLKVGDKSSQLPLTHKNIVPPTIQEAPGLENVDKYQAQFNQRLDKLRADTQAKVDKSTIVWGNITSGLGPAVVDLGSQLRGAAASAATGLGELIGSVASGGASLGSALGKLVGVMGQFIIDFGKSLIEAATLRIIAEKTLFANPYVALAAGIGAVAIGSILKNKVPSFASGGGMVGAPGLAMIGDNPGREEYVIPSEVLDKLGRGRDRIGRLTAIVRGQDLLLATDRARRGQRRVN